ncbi:MAG: KamA family radical SAM protein [Bacteroidales bacterium]|jgi:lysine 2,3-aminomutase|nr:KamA family radical SAM protein [Bacteroidales bacterium]
MDKIPSEKPDTIHPEISEEEEPPSKSSFIDEASLLDEYLKSRNDRDKNTISERSLSFLQTFFPEATIKEWNSWHWQIKNSARSIEQLARYIWLSENEVKPDGPNSQSLPLRISPYYISLLDRNNPEQALRKSVVPVFDEFLLHPGEASDPLSEEHDSPVPNVVHRYPDRVLFLVTGFCSTYCRYCTRTRMVAKDKCHIGVKVWEAGLNYIEQHTEIRDVLISGGDPLTMPDLHVEYLLSRLRSIPHVEIIRIGTKVPAVLPQRITRPLVNMLKKYHPLFISIHFTHADEITPEVTEACEKLVNAGIPLGSQTVLLKGINDDVQVMKKLMHALLKIRVRPYYLYQCDPVVGSGHFRTTIEKGLEIIRGLRGHTSGYAVPTYVVDAPGGGGKIPLLPDYFVGREDDFVLLKNYEDKLFRYPDYST